MTLSVKHAFQSAKSDGVDPTDVQPSNWNAAHALTCATGVVLGRQTAGVGAVEELALSSFLTAAGGTLIGALIGADAGVWNSNGFGNVKSLGVGVAADVSLASAYFKSAIGTVFIDGSDNTLRRSLLRFVNPDGEVGQLGDALSTFSLSSGAFGISAIFSHMYYGSNSGYHIWGRQNSGFTEYMRMSSDGSFAVGRTDTGGAGAILAQGNIYTASNILASGDITAFNSDMRLKTGIKPIRNALKKVLALSGFTYKLNDTAKKIGIKGNRRYVGVSAQAVQKVLPWAVRPAPANKKYLTVQYEKLVPLLIEAIKEQQEQIDELKQKLAKK